MHEPYILYIVLTYIPLYRARGCNTICVMYCVDRWVLALGWNITRVFSLLTNGLIMRAVSNGWHGFKTVSPFCL